MCNSGVGLTPIVDGQIHHFSAGGLYNGLILLIDDETRTYWDHISGEALHGPLSGTSLPMWGIEQSTVGALRKTEPQLRLHLNRTTWWTRLVTWLTARWHGKLPPGFRFTMDRSDDRLGEMEIGLGLADGAGKFFPINLLPKLASDQLDQAHVENWQGKAMRIYIDASSSIPRAEYVDGTMPPQLFSRWYGYSRTYPNCEIMDDASSSP